MGVLRYFPGSEPPGEPRHAPPRGRHPAGARRHEAAPSTGESPSDAGEPGVAEPVWAVPVVGIGHDDRMRDELAVEIPEQAHAASLGAIATRDVSEEELRRKLLARAFEPEAVEAELARLRAVGLLDDRALAERLVARLRERKGMGDGAIRPALRARSIAGDVIDAVLAGEHDDEADHERLLDLARDRARRLGGLDAAVAERRLIAYLARKGHGGSDARQAARIALEELR